MRITNFYSQTPSVAPVASNIGSGTVYFVAHRRVNQDETYTSISPITTNVALPSLITPQAYTDATSLKRDEILVSNDGVTWRVYPRDASGTGPLTITEFSTSWTVASITGNQDDFSQLINFGEFTGGSNPTAVVYAVNDGNSINQITVQLTNTSTNEPAVDFNNKLQVDLQETRTATGNNGNTSFNGSVVWGLPSLTLNTLRVLLPTGSFVKLQLSLINFPSGGLDSIVYNLNFAVLGNVTNTSVSYPDQWVEGSLVYDLSQGLGVNVVEAVDGTTLRVNPFITKRSSVIQRHLVALNIGIPGAGDYKLWFSNTGQFLLEVSTDPDLDNHLLVAEFTWATATPFISNVQYSWPIRTFNFGFRNVAGGAIARGVFVTSNGSDELVPSTAAGGTLGVSLRTDEGFYAKGGFAWLRLGEAATAGALLGPGANGDGFLSSGNLVKAVTGGSAGEYVLVEILSYAVTQSGGGGGSGGNADTLNNQPGSFYLNRANHTGANNADTLQGQAGSFYLDRSNHTGTQPASSITGLGTASALDVAASGDAAAGQVVLGSDTRLKGWLPVFTTSLGAAGASITVPAGVLQVNKHYQLRMACRISVTGGIWAQVNGVTNNASYSGVFFSNNHTGTVSNSPYNAPEVFGSFVNQTCVFEMNFSVFVGRYSWYSTGYRQSTLGAERVEYSGSLTAGGVGSLTSMLLRPASGNFLAGTSVTLLRLEV